MNTKRVKDSVPLKRQLMALVMAWLIFIGIDFLFHASLLRDIWKEPIEAIKPLDQLAVLIPAGYFSFLLLTTLIGYLYFKIYEGRPLRKDLFAFSLVLGGLYTLSHLFGLFSYVNIPFAYLAIFQGVYLLEIVVIVFVIDRIAFSGHLRADIARCVGIFFVLVIAGIVIQNIV